MKLAAEEMRGISVVEGIWVMSVEEEMWVISVVEEI